MAIPHLHDRSDGRARLGHNDNRAHSIGEVLLEADLLKHLNRTVEALHAGEVSVDFTKRHLAELIRVARAIPDR